MERDKRDDQITETVSIGYEWTPYARIAALVVAFLPVCGGFSVASALPPGAEDAWAGLAFDGKAFAEVVELGTGQHLVAKTPAKAWRAAADGAMRTLEQRYELVPRGAMKRVTGSDIKVLLRGTVVPLFCAGKRHKQVDLLRFVQRRRIPKMGSVKEIRAFRAKRRKLRKTMDKAWSAVRFGEADFRCVMSWVQSRLPLENASLVDRSAGAVRLATNASVTGATVTRAAVTRLQQRRWDAWRIAASLFLQSLDPHCNVYPDRLFEAQEAAAATSKPPRAYLLDPKDTRVGVLHVAQFATGTAKQARGALAELRKSTRGRLKAVILDMRGNTGGWVDEALAFADMFLQRGVITQVVSRHDPVKIHRATKKRDDVLLPMVVLIDGRCRSSCELVAAALHENNRALVVGAQSWGKATVQGVFEAQRGAWSVFVTIARYHGPRGDSLQRYGVRPDVVVDQLAQVARKDWRESRFQGALAPARTNPPHRSKLLDGPAFRRCQLRTCTGQAAPLCIARSHVEMLIRGAAKKCMKKRSRKLKKKRRAR